MVQRHTSRPRPTRRAASRTRKRRFTCRTSPSPTPTASRPASASAWKATRRSASPRRPVRRHQWLMPSLRPAAEDRVSRAHPRRDEGAVRLHQRDADPQAGQDRPEHGHRRSRGRLQEGQRGDEGSGGDRRPEAGADQGPQVHRRLQAARRHGHRRQGHPAQGPDVRVPRPSDHHRPAAREGLPRPEADLASTAAATTPWA